jgi:hypothetical protein
VLPRADEILPSPCLEGKDDAPLGVAQRGNRRGYLGKDTLPPFMFKTAADFAAGKLLVQPEKFLAYVWYSKHGKECTGGVRRLLVQGHRSRETPRG